MARTDAHVRSVAITARAPEAREPAALLNDRGDAA